MGLPDAEARARLKRYGPNRLREQAARSAWTILVNQFRSLVVALLVVSGAVSLAMGEYPDAIAIAVVIMVNTAIGFGTELRAARSMEALVRLGSVETRVRRDGETRMVPAAELVPGDIVLLEGGDMVTVDLRLVEVSRLEADESALTGESVPVAKSVEPVAEDAPLAERTCMLFKGTSVTRGSGLGVVTATGMNTELGAISSLVESAEEETTPLEERLDALGRKLVWVILVVTTIVAGLGIARGRDMFLMFETGIALAVASIPEGLPIVATIALSRGMLRMARRNALVRSLASVETLGSTNVICTDKTGTLTENQMTATRVVTDAGACDRDPSGAFSREGVAPDLAGDAALRQLVEVAVLCNNAALDGETGVGDPMEVALLALGDEFGIDRRALASSHPEEREEAFDNATNMMATFHTKDGEYLVAVKGAPEAVLAASTRVAHRDGEETLDAEQRAQWEAENDALAGEGFRVLGVACKHTGSPDDAPYDGLTFLGLVGLEDPPREDIREAIARCKGAGIDVVMVTGDQIPTARSVAHAVGIVDRPDAHAVRGDTLKTPDELSGDESARLRETRIFARVSPRQKLDLIALHQGADAVVAMTGDGVNDAPALKKADIGVAMGQRGTQVARDVADVVLKDDSFRTIVYAVEEGRNIFGNIRKFVLYLLSCNIAEILVIFLATLFNTTLPILPLQILFLNLVTDVFPALALGVGEGSTEVMRQRPRKASESILTRRHWMEIGGYGTVIAVATLGAFFVALGPLALGEREAVTVSFLTLAFAQLWHVFNMRGANTRLWANDVVHNPWVWGALALCIGLLIAAVRVPPLQQVLNTSPIGLGPWMLVMGLSALPLVLDLALRFVYTPASR